MARYHKKHLFFEFHYDTPLTTDITYFDTPFGRIGTFVCFDVIFHDPPVTLIDNHNIDTVAFPTAWMNVLPYFSAVPFHSAFAKGMGVNFLSSNLHDPANRFSGSGVYSYEQVETYRNDETSDAGALLIAELPSKPVKTPRQEVDFQNVEGGDAEFSNIIFGDEWNFVALKKDSSEAFVCQNTLCCHLSYTKNDEDLFALGVFKGLHTEEGTYYLEMCGLLKCKGQAHETCGQDVRTSNSFFSFFNLTGNFSTQYVFPMVVSDEMNPSAGDWSYDGRSTISYGTKTGLISAIQFGRRYDLDNTSNAESTLFRTCYFSSFLCCLFLFLFLFVSDLFLIYFE